MLKNFLFIDFLIMLYLNKVIRDVVIHSITIYIGHWESVKASERGNPVLQYPQKMLNNFLFCMDFLIMLCLSKVIKDVVYFSIFIQSNINRYIGH